MHEVCLRAAEQRSEAIRVAWLLWLTQQQIIIPSSHGDIMRSIYWPRKKNNMFLTYLTLKIAHAKLTLLNHETLLDENMQKFESEVKCIYRYSLSSFFVRVWVSAIYSITLCYGSYGSHVWLAWLAGSHIGNTLKYPCLVLSNFFANSPWKCFWGFIRQLKCYYFCKSTSVRALLKKQTDH